CLSRAHREGRAAHPPRQQRGVNHGVIADLSPHPEEPRKRRLEGEARTFDSWASWFETALTRLLTMRVWQPGSSHAYRLALAEPLLVGPDIGLGRRAQMAPVQLDQFIATRRAQRRDHLEMIAARAVERFGKRVRVGADAVDLLCKHIDGLDQAGIAAEA